MNILFVCTGNTCRSCMAEAIFNALNDAPNTIAYSAGISVQENSMISTNANLVVKENLNVDLGFRHAVQLKQESINCVDLVLTMTSSMKKLLVNYFPDSKNKIFSLNEYVGLNGDIIDPFGGNINIYRNTYKELKNSILSLICKIKEDRHIL